MKVGRNITFDIPLGSMDIVTATGMSLPYTPFLVEANRAYAGRSGRWTIRDFSSSFSDDPSDVVNRAINNRFPIVRNGFNVYVVRTERDGGVPLFEFNVGWLTG